jgi:predicted esterase YcpF (UPF0227 family)
VSIPVLYFHGFASSPNSAKVTALRELLEPEFELITPDLNVPSFAELDYDRVVALGVSLAREHNPRVIAGSSFGAIVALEVIDAGVRAPLVLIAPALSVAQRWKDHIPPGDPVMMFNHVLGHDAPIHRAFFNQMFQVTVDEAAPATKVVVLMGRNDETVPFTIVEERWNEWSASGKLVEGSRFIAIEGGDHSLVSEVEQIAREIREAARA